MSGPGDPGRVVGIDVGGTKMLGVLIDPAHPSEPLVVLRRPTPAEASQLIDSLAAMVAELSGATASQPYGIAGVGIGAAGLVDRRGRFDTGPNLGAASGLDLAAALTGRGVVAGAPVWVDNDATTATLAEVRLGAARGARDAVLVTLGTGIGGGIVADGSVVRGAHGFAGEVGHMVIEPAGLTCACGRRGCWETRASGSALARAVRHAVGAGHLQAVVDAAGGDPDAVTPEAVTQAAAGGDAEAQAVVDAFAWWVALGLANLVAVLDPQRIVVAGGLVEAGETLLRPVRRALDDLALASGSRRSLEVVPAALGAASCAIGAALLALDAVGSPEGEVVRLRRGPPLP